MCRPSARWWLGAGALLALASGACGSGRPTDAEEQARARLEAALGLNAPPERGRPSTPYFLPATAPLPASGEGSVPEPEAACPSGLVPVAGQYCTEVRQQCTRWLDDPKLPYARCAEYAQPATCVGERVAMSFCIDRREYTEPGQTLPLNWMSFNGAAQVCRSRGLRVCTEREWNFACEGEEMRPYPYGWKREPVCNYDQSDLYVQTPKKRLLKDLRQPSGANPECVSPFGVLDMVGNVDEPVLREEARYNPPFRNALKGGWWMAARNRCRPATTAHDDHYNDLQVGVRCCAEGSTSTKPSG